MPTLGDPSLAGRAGRWITGSDKPNGRRSEPPDPKEDTKRPHSARKQPVNSGKLPGTKPQAGALFD